MIARLLPHSQKQMWEEKGARCQVPCVTQTDRSLHILLAVHKGEAAPVWLLHASSCLPLSPGKQRLVVFISGTFCFEKVAIPGHCCSERKTCPTYMLCCYPRSPEKMQLKKVVASHVHTGQIFPFHAVTITLIVGTNTETWNKHGL